MCLSAIRRVPSRCRLTPFIVVSIAVACQGCSSSFEAAANTPEHPFRRYVTSSAYAASVYYSDSDASPATIVVLRTGDADEYAIYFTREFEDLRHFMSYLLESPVSRSACEDFDIRFKTGMHEAANEVIAIMNEKLGTRHDAVTLLIPDDHPISDTIKASVARLHYNTRILYHKPEDFATDSAKVDGSHMQGGAS